MLKSGNKLGGWSLPLSLLGSGFCQLPGGSHHYTTPPPLTVGVLELQMHAAVLFDMSFRDLNAAHQASASAL